MRTVMGVAALALLAGCATTEESRQAAQQPAIDAAIARAASEMNCREAKANVLSRRAAPGGYGGERYEYTIAVEGCGRKMSSIVICSAGNCFVAGSTK